MTLQLGARWRGGVALGDPGHPDACPRHREPNLPAAKERGSRVLGRTPLRCDEVGSEGVLLYADVDPALARQQDFVYAQDASRRIGSLSPLTSTHCLSIQNCGPRRLVAFERLP